VPPFCLTADKRKFLSADRQGRFSQIAFGNFFICKILGEICFAGLMFASWVGEGKNFLKL
jgi:hypothetical protein